MIPTYRFDIDAECDHCHKTRLGAFTASINSRRLKLCFKCLANMLGVFGEEPDPTPGRTASLASNGQ